MFDEAASGEARAALHRVPVDTNVAVAALDVAVLPTLPPAQATRPPEAATARAATMPTIADVRQFQNAQRRQARKNRDGRVMGRLMLVIVLFAAGVGLALTVGRDYLFPDGWSPELEALAAEVELEHGAEFDKAVPLVDQRADDYAGTTIMRAVFGPDATARAALWRALGVASGEVDSYELSAGLAAASRAVYDAASESIVRVADVNVDFDLRQPLADALVHQLDGGQSRGDLLGPMPAANVRGAEIEVPGDPFQGIREVVWQVTEGVVRSSDVAHELPAYDESAELRAPLPVQYQVVASATSSIALYDAGVTLPTDVLDHAPEAALAAGDTPLEPAVSLGIDDWTLVWANRLPADSVATLVAATKGDSLRTFERAGVSCAAAVFESHNELYSAATLNELGRWAAAAPIEAEVAVTSVSSTHVQLTACDPGPDIVQPLQFGAVEAVIRGQLDRIAAAVAAAPPSTIESTGPLSTAPSISAPPTVP